MFHIDVDCKSTVKEVRITNPHQQNNHSNRTPLTRICNLRFFNPGFVILLNEKEAFETMFHLDVDCKSTVKEVRITNPHQRALLAKEIRTSGLSHIIEKRCNCF